MHDTRTTSVPSLIPMPDVEKEKGPGNVANSVPNCYAIARVSGTRASGDKVML